MSLLDQAGRPSPASNSASSMNANRPLHRLKSEQHGGQATFVSSVVNLLNTIVGAGMLAMPGAMSHMGIVPGVMVIIWAGLTAGFGLYLQTRCARYLDRGFASFFALSQMTYPRASIIFDAAIAIKCFGVGVSYLIIIGDLMPGVVQGLNRDPDRAAFLTDRHFWITAFMLVVIPFSFLRRLDSLKYTSFIALVSIGYLIILVFAHFVSGDTMKQKGHINVLHWAGPVQFLSSLPIMVFAYTCHQNMFSILNEMKDDSPRKTTGVVGASIGSASAMYALVAITGYLSFGDNVSGNIVGMYKPSVASTVGKAAIVVLVMFSYPLQVHPCRASVDAVLKWRPDGPTTRSESPTQAALVPGAGQRQQAASPPRRNGTAGDSMSDSRFALITTGIVIFSYMVAMTVSSLERVLAYVGSTGSTSISFILPGIFFYKISAPDSPHQQRLQKEDDDAEAASAPILAHNDDDDDEEEPTLTYSFDRGPAWRRAQLRRASLALACYGMVVMVVCLITNTYFTVAH